MENTPEEELNRSQLWYKNPHKYISGIIVSCVILGFHEGKVKVLLGKIKDYDKWMLPSGFVHESEDIDDAVHDVLNLRTGLEQIYLRQFQVFGRKDRGELESTKALVGFLEERAGLDDDWFLGRNVTIGYFAFINYDKVQTRTNIDEDAAWFDIKEVPSDLFADHNIIIEEGIKHLRKWIKIAPIGLELLSDKFTMNELRAIYETILDCKLDKRNFQRNLLATGYIIKLEEQQRTPGIKPSNLYIFDIEKYQKGVSRFE